MVWRVARTYLRPLLTMMGVDSSYSNSCQILDHPRREIKVGMQIQKKDHPRADDHPDIGFEGRGSQTIQTFWSDEHFTLCQLHATVRFLAASNVPSKLFPFGSER